MNHPRSLRLVLSLVLVASACSTPDDGPKAKTPGEGGPEKRDTEMKHEPCDGNSSSARKVDVNGDGKPDIIHVMDGNREICRIVDLNHDGRVDAFIYYDEQGRERRRESDFDRDGRADEIALYKDGHVYLKMRETNFDNKIDTWDYYENDRLVRRERDSDGDGVIDQWWNFNNPTNPKCAVVASSRGSDGKPDPKSVVDLCADSNGAPAAPSANPSASASAAAAAAPPTNTAAVSASGSASATPGKPPPAKKKGSTQ